MKQRTKNWLLDLLFLLLGCSVYTAGVICFLTPSEITPGGFTGVATLLGTFVGLTSGVWYLIMNLPLLFIALRKFGASFIWKTGIAIVLNSLLLDVYQDLLPKYTGDRLLAAVFGGVVVGTGLGLVMLRGATTGGVDVLAKLIHLRWPHLSMGRGMMAIDGLIVAIAALAYRNADTALYSIVTIFTSTFLLDRILYGSEKGKLLFIITTHPREVIAGISADAHRGVTCVQTTGAYTGRAYTMLLCAVRRTEVSAVMSATHRADAAAFMVVTEAGEILGEGFPKRME